MVSSKLIFSFSRHAISSKLIAITLLLLAACSWCYFILEEFYQAEIKQLKEREIALETIAKEGNLLYNIVIYNLLTKQSESEETPPSLHQFSEWESRLQNVLNELSTIGDANTTPWREFFLSKKANSALIDQLILESDFRSGILLYSLPTLTRGNGSRADSELLYFLKRGPALYFSYIASLTHLPTSSDALAQQNLQKWFANLKERAQVPQHPRLTFALQNAIESGVAVLEHLNDPQSLPELYQALFTHLQLLQKAWNVLLEGLSRETQELLHSTIEMHWISFLLPLTLILATLFIVYLLYQEFAPPLRQLEAGLKALEEGDTTTRVKTIYPDFFGEMGKNFNAIAEAFEKVSVSDRSESAQLTSAHDHIEELSRTYEMGIAEQQRLIQELAAKLETLLSSMSHLSTTLQEIGSSPLQTTKTAFNTQTAVETIKHLLHEVQESSLTMSSKLSLLNEKAQQIAHSVASSSQIGAQMQLIALKAAIEAEKAGEHGRSFAVIAREVRMFADQIAQSMHSIKQATEETSSAIISRIMAFEKFFQELQSGLNGVQRIVDGLAQVMEKIHVQEITIENLHLSIKEQIRASIQLHEGVSDIGNQARLLSQNTQKFALPLHAIDQSTKRLANKNF